MAKDSGRSKREAAAFWVATSELMPWVDNPRVKDKAHISAIAASIRAAAKAVAESMGRDVDLEDGFGAPVVARAENGEIIAGHTRLYAAAELGMPRVPVRFMDLPEDAAHRLARADNRGTETGAWDYELLLKQLRVDHDAGGAKALESQGFSLDDYQRLMGKPEPQLRAIDVDDLIGREFWINVRGPLPKQADAIDKLRQALADLSGVTVKIGTT